MFSEEDRREFIAATAEIARQVKTDHFCMTAGCEECRRNTRIQMARNSISVVITS